MKNEKANSTTWRSISMWIQNLLQFFKPKRSRVSSMGEFQGDKLGTSENSSSWFKKIDSRRITAYIKNEEYSELENHIERNYVIPMYSEFHESRNQSDDLSNIFGIVEKVKYALDNNKDAVLQKHPEMAMLFANRHAFELIQNIQAKSYCDYLFHYNLMHLRSVPKGEIFNNIKPGPDAPRLFVELIIQFALNPKDISEKILPISNIKILSSMMKLIARMIIHLRFFDEINTFEKMKEEYWGQACALFLFRLIDNPLELMEESLSEFKLNEELKSLGLNTQTKNDKNLSKEDIMKLSNILRDFKNNVISFFPEYPQMKELIIEKIKKEKEAKTLDENDFE